MSPWPAISIPASRRRSILRGCCWSASATTGIVIGMSRVVSISARGWRQRSRSSRPSSMSPLSAISRSYIESHLRPSSLDQEGISSTRRPHQIDHGESYHEREREYEQAEAERRYLPRRRNKVTGQWTDDRPNLTCLPSRFAHEGIDLGFGEARIKSPISIVPRYSLMGGRYNHYKQTSWGHERRGRRDKMRVQSAASRDIGEHHHIKQLAFVPVPQVHRGKGEVPRPRPRGT